MVTSAPAAEADVWGGVVIVPTDEDEVGLPRTGPPSSVGAKGLPGKALFEIEYVSPLRLQVPPQ